MLLYNVRIISLTPEIRGRSQLMVPIKANPNHIKNSTIKNNNTNNINDINDNKNTALQCCLLVVCKFYIT